jgi:splicing factor U2AF subunit
MMNDWCEINDVYNSDVLLLSTENNNYYVFVYYYPSIARQMQSIYFLSSFSVVVVVVAVAVVNDDNDAVVVIGYYNQCQSQRNDRNTQPNWFFFEVERALCYLFDSMGNSIHSQTELFPIKKKRTTTEQMDQQHQYHYQDQKQEEHAGKRSSYHSNHIQSQSYDRSDRHYHHHHHGGTATSTTTTTTSSGGGGGADGTGVDGGSRRNRDYRYRRSRSPRGESDEESPPKRRERRKRRRTLFDVGPQEMLEMGLQGAVFGVAPTSSNLNPTTGNIVVPQPYKNSFGVTVRPTFPSVTATYPTINTPIGLINSVSATPGVPSNLSATDKQQRRVYVGNIPKDCTEQELVFFFTDMLKRAFPDAIPANDNLLAATTLNYDKLFAFLDFTSPDYATYAMALDGIKFRDSNILKIRRPKDYKAPPGGDPSLHLDRSKMGNVPGLISTNVPDSPNKLFIGGLPPHMTEDQVLQFLGTFGPLKAFNLVKDINTGLSRGYAFCEYLNGAKDTDEAIKGMNGLEMHGKKLVVQRASVGAKGEEGVDAMPMQLQAETILANDPEKAAVASILNLSTKVENVLANLAQYGDLHVHPTKILVLLNLVSLNDLAKDDVYNEIYRDIYHECAKYGRVVNLLIPRPTPDKDLDDPTHDKGPFVGRIFIEYENAQQAQRAQQALAGRRYQGRLVVTTFCSEDDFYNSGLLNLSR